jgi:hypothetical protein
VGKGGEAVVSVESSRIESGRVARGEGTLNERHRGEDGSRERGVRGDVARTRGVARERHRRFGGSDRVGRGRTFRASSSSCARRCSSRDLNAPDMVGCGRENACSSSASSLPPRSSSARATGERVRNHARARARSFPGSSASRRAPDACVSGGRGARSLSRLGRRKIAPRGVDGSSLMMRAAPAAAKLAGGICPFPFRFWRPD